MKTRICIGVTTFLVSSLLAADRGRADEVADAAKKLADQPNYSWRTTVTVPEGSRFRPGPTEGKATKEGLTSVSMSFGDNKLEMVAKGEKVAVLNQEGAWKSVSELENAEGPGRFVAVIARNIRTPATQVAELATSTKGLKKDGDSFSGELTEEGAKKLLRFGRGGDAQTVSDAKGSVKIWLKDGELAKYEYKVQGKVNFNNNDVPVDRTTTVEIKDVGKTKVEVPEEAKKIVQ